jgi:hypothetical protein
MVPQGRAQAAERGAVDSEQRREAEHEQGGTGQRAAAARGRQRPAGGCRRHSGRSPATWRGDPEIAVAAGSAR